MHRFQYHRRDTQHAFNFAPGRNQENQIPRSRYPRHHEQPYSSDEYWCETCDRAFPTVAKLEEHKQQHQKCNIDGCQFTAHPNMVTKHIQMQHATGLFKKIGNLNSPEDINKWREERKKKYPTKHNVEKKAAEVKEKIERGEKMGLQQHRFSPRNNEHNSQNGKNGWKRNQPFGRDNQRGNKIPPKKIRKKFPIRKPDTDITVSENRGTLKPFGGIHQTVDVDDASDDEQVNDLIDDDFIDDIPIETAIEKKGNDMCSAISTLISNYGSSDEETVDSKSIRETEPAPVEKNSSDKSEDTKNVDKVINHAEKLEDDDDSGPEEVKVEKIRENDNPEPSNQDKKTNKQSRRDKIDTKTRRQLPIQRKQKIPSTLIYKLLHKEIKQERNIVLQCVRHIVNNNYFDKCKQ